MSSSIICCTFGKNLSPLTKQGVINKFFIKINFAQIFFLKISLVYNELCCPLKAEYSFDDKNWTLVANEKEHKSEYNNLRTICRKWFFSRIEIKGSWFVNHESISWSREPKTTKTSIFLELFFRYIITVKQSTLAICLSICVEVSE